MIESPAARLHHRVVSAPHFEHHHRVTYADCTVGNHIYYSRYLDLLETARGEFFRHLGLTLLELQSQSVIFPVIECRVRYKAAARYDDQLTIAVWPNEIEKIRLNFSHRITNQNGVLILQAETFHVCTGTDDKLRRLPENLVSLLHPFLPAPQSAKI